MRVLEVLTGEVAVVRRHEPILGAIRRMRDEHVGALVVVDESDLRRPIGMLTDRDIVVGIFAKDETHIGTLEVGDVMTPDLVTATSDEDVGDVLRRMRSFGVRRVPVVDERGALEGIVSIDDVIGAISDALADAASLVSNQRRRESERRP